MSRLEAGLCRATLLTQCNLASRIANWVGYVWVLASSKPRRAVESAHRPVSGGHTTRGANMQARNTATAVFVQAECDPALLAFIKCHLTSMARWNILRVLGEDPGYHWPLD